MKFFEADLVLATDSDTRQYVYLAIAENEDDAEVKVREYHNENILGRISYNTVHVHEIPVPVAANFPGFKEYKHESTDSEPIEIFVPVLLIFNDNN